MFSFKHEVSFFIFSFRIVCVSSENFLIVFHFKIFFFNCLGKKKVQGKCKVISYMVFLCFLSIQKKISKQKLTGPKLKYRKS